MESLIHTHKSLSLKHAITFSSVFFFYTQTHSLCLFSFPLSISFFPLLSLSFSHTLFLCLSLSLSGSPYFRLFSACEMDNRKPMLLSSLSGFPVLLIYENFGSVCLQLIIVMGSNSNRYDSWICFRGSVIRAQRQLWAVVVLFSVSRRP